MGQITPSEGDSGLPDCHCPGVEALCKSTAQLRKCGCGCRRLNLRGPNPEGQLGLQGFAMGRLLRAAFDALHPYLLSPPAGVVSSTVSRGRCTTIGTHHLYRNGRNRVARTDHAGSVPPADEYVDIRHVGLECVDRTSPVTRGPFHPFHHGSMGCNPGRS